MLMSKLLSYVVAYLIVFLILNNVLPFFKNKAIVQNKMLSE